MQDLLTVLPFLGVGIVMVLVALAFGWQTTLSARQLDERKNFRLLEQDRTRVDPSVPDKPEERTQRAVGAH